MCGTLLAFSGVSQSTQFSLVIHLFLIFSAGAGFHFLEPIRNLLQKSELPLPLHFYSAFTFLIPAFFEVVPQMHRL
jgi:hypothetical protein